VLTPDPATGGDSLPEPTGAHSVGRVSFDWVDPARTEIYAANPEDRRELVVFVWYPAEPQPTAEFAPYLPSAWAPAAEFLGLDVAGMRSHAIPDAPLAADYPAYCCSPPAVSRRCCWPRSLRSWRATVSSSWG
jgi:hypothetical protein